MKPEPLKCKLQKDNINWAINKDENFCLVENFFYFDDIRSAVKGLLEEIEKKKAEVFKAAKEVGETSFHKGMIQGLLTVEEIIKEWLPDLFKERD